jgi:two-component system sensor histidine kinase AtoS
MRPRARFTVAFLFLQIIPIIAIGVVTLAYTLKTVIDEVVESSDLMTRQVYEQVRLGLEHGKGDAVTVLQHDDALRELLGSMQAFGPAVVIARITDANGKILVAAGDGSEGQFQPHLPSIEELVQKASRWWPFALLAAASGNDLYATARPFDVDGKPFGTIYIGVTLSLLADRLERLGLAFALIVIADVILTLLATASLRRLLFQEMWPFPAVSWSARVTESLPPAQQDELSGLAERFNRLSREVHSEHNQWETGRSNVFDIVRSIHDGVVLVDSGGSLLFANREARAVLGLDKNPGVEGRPLGVLLRRNHPLVAMAEAALESGSEAQDVPMNLSGNGDGDGGSMLISFFRLGAARKPVGLLILLRDMNAVQELESVVDHSTRLARLGGLISGVAHQLRSPLHGMNLRLELLREDAMRGNDIEKHINRLRGEVERLDQSVEALLRFMRPQELKLSRFLVNDLLTEIANRIKRERICFAFQFSAEHPVEADREMLAEAFTNLIQNAMQAMPEGGGITISTAEKDAMVEVEIADHGIGIAPENLDQVLNLYFTTKKGGSGLGLPLALRAIELNRGVLKIDSRVGEGTTCRIRLPLASDAAPQISSTAV